MKIRIGRHKWRYAIRDGGHYWNITFVFIIFDKSSIGITILNFYIEFDFNKL